jgi:hypothetical protein
MDSAPTSEGLVASPVAVLRAKLVVVRIARDSVSSPLPPSPPPPAPFRLFAAIALTGKWVLCLGPQAWSCSLGTEAPRWKMWSWTTAARNQCQRTLPVPLAPRGTGWMVAGSWQAAV